MTDPQYDNLVDRAALSFRKHGIVDLVDLSEAASLGVDVETFTADVADAATIEE